MLNNDVPICVFTHSDYSDCWPILFDSFEKYWPDHPEIIVFSNCHIPDKKCLLYQDGDPYSNRLLSCLYHINSEYIIFLHEDMMLYDYVKEDILHQYYEFLRQSKSPGAVRLTYARHPSHNCLMKINTQYNLYKIERGIPFVIQPSIINRQYFIDVVGSVQSCKSPSSLEGALMHHDDLLKKYDVYAHFAPHIQRGVYHFDSEVFPYFATAVVAGKWNTKEYPNLEPVLTAYDINVCQRGVC